MSVAADLEITSVDWSAFVEHHGPATRVGVALRGLLNSTDVESASAAWELIEEHVFSQGTIYPVAEPTVSVLLAALTEDQPPWRSGRIVDLLFFIVSGASQSDLTLQVRCRDRAREGLWLLVRCALAADGWGRDNLLEVIGVIAPERIEMIRAAIDEQ
ncbi:MAG: hypothetical protein GY720_16215 [bacterium]|nr:hypothetical protein [bacterium]